MGNDYFEERPALYLFLAFVVVFIFLIGLIAVCAVPAESQTGGTVFRVRSFGGPWTPIVPPYQNNPEALTKVQNFMTLQPGSRQLRTGISQLIDYDSMKTVVSDPIDAIRPLYFKTDSSALVFCSGGLWYWTYWAERRYGRVTWMGGAYMYETSAVVKEVTPYTPGSITVGASIVDTVQIDDGGTTWLVDAALTQGDDYWNGGWIKIVQTTHPDKDSVRQIADFVDASDSASWTTPFSNTLSLGDAVELGLYTTDTAIGVGTRFVRDVQPGDTLFAAGDTFLVERIISDTRLIVDSAPVRGGTDADYKLRRRYQDSAWTATDSTFAPFLLQSGDLMYTGSPRITPQILYKDDEDSLRMRRMGIVDSFYIDTIYHRYPADTSDWPDVYYRNWDTLSSSDTVIRMIQIVSRSKIGVWQYDQWLSNIGDGPEAYYVRLGYQDDNFYDAGKFFQIAGNTDTSLFLYAWYIDSTLGGNNWIDSIFYGHALYLTQQPDSSVIDGTWGYIYTSCGNATTVVSDEQTDTIQVISRGAMFRLVDTTMPISADTFYTGMYFIRLTGDDVGFPSYVETKGYKKIRGDTASCGLVESGWRPFLGQHDTIISVNKIERSGYCAYGFVIANKNDTLSVTRDAEFLGRRSFPIRYAVQDNDTMYFISGIASSLTDATVASTDNWELVRVDIPTFGGMTEWNNPPQLVGWGDSTGGSVLSFSGVNDPWNWSVNSDVLVGNNPSDPIVACVGYDDQLVIFKGHSMNAFDGSRFTELSQTDGLVGPRAVVGLNKYLYWLDVDGVKRMQRRDFSGYSVEKISTAIDPILNAWSNSYYSGDVVPLAINPAYRYLSVLVHDQRNQHFYLFFPAGNNAENSHALTYHLQSGEWDGWQTIKASDAVWANVRDTSRVVFGSPDSAMILALDYGWRDLPTGKYAATGIDSAWTGIDGILKSGRFWLTDEQGWPVDSKVGTIRLFWRGISSSLDTAVIKMVGEGGITHNFAITGPSSLKDTVSFFRPSTDYVSRHWYWEIDTEGDHINGNIFMPYMMDIELIPTGRDD